MTIARAKCLLTFMIDLNPYENFLMTLAVDVENAATVARNFIQFYDTSR